MSTYELLVKENNEFICSERWHDLTAVHLPPPAPDMGAVVVVGEYPMTVSGSGVYTEALPYTTYRYEVEAWLPVAKGTVHRWALVSVDATRSNIWDRVVALYRRWTAK